MSPPLAVLLPFLLAIVALALAMVFVMVRWGRALLERPPRPETVRSWWIAYLAVWALLVAVFLGFLRKAGSTPPDRDLPLMLLVAAGWIGFSYALVAFARALQRVNEPTAPPPAVRRRAPVVEHRVPEEPFSSPFPAARSRLRELLGQALGIAAALVVIFIGSLLPPLQWLHDWTQAHQRPLLWITIPLAAVGFTLFMGCAIAMVLARGKPMSRREIDEMSRRILERSMGPASARAAVYRNLGQGVGARAEDSASFAEVKQAWAARAWEFSPRWRRMFLMALGAALLSCGIFGSLFVIAPAGVKLLLGGACVYAVARTVIGFARA